MVAIVAEYQDIFRGDYDGTKFILRILGGERLFLFVTIYI